MLMWLCKMVYVEIILGRGMNRSTIPYTNVELKVTLCYWNIPSVVLSHNENCSPLLTWQPLTKSQLQPYIFHQTLALVQLQ